MNNQNMQTVPVILTRFANLLGTTIQRNRLEIPAKFGQGYCTGYVFNKNIRLLVSNYQLNQVVLVDNSELHTRGKVIFFKFQHIFGNSAMIPVTQSPSVLVATSRINTDEVITIHSNTATVNIEVDADYLREIIGPNDKSPILQSLIENTQPLLFEQLVYSSLKKIVDEIVTAQANQTFGLFFLRLKSEELICRLLMELEKREHQQLYPLNKKDIQAIYLIKQQILDNLQTPPVINNLATNANMSPTKLKRLFKQIFGDSIFSYYQHFRINEAARLLKEEKLSVSAAGYQMGFTNLSHFARVFEEYMGIKPKRYTMM